jgi:predicted O-methyltransferase YrrM
MRAVSEPMLYQADLGWRGSTVAGALRLRPAIAQHSVAEGAALERWAAGARTVVEIGVAEGGSAWHARKVMDPQGTLVLIDTYPKRFGLNLSSIIARRLVGREPRGAVVWRHERSDVAVKDWSAPIDFLLIDGDHAYEAARRDWEDWSPHMAPDGVVAFHDAVVGTAPWMDESFGSARFVTELRERENGWQMVESADSLAVFKRA